MVVEVNFTVLSPHRVMELERDVDELIPERFQFGHAFADDCPERVDAERAAVRIEFDNSNFEGVHVHVGRFAVQQYRVPTAEPFHLSPLVMA